MPVIARDTVPFDTPSATATSSILTLTSLVRCQRGRRLVASSSGRRRLCGLRHRAARNRLRTRLPPLSGVVNRVAPGGADCCQTVMEGEDGAVGWGSPARPNARRARRRRIGRHLIWGVLVKSGHGEAARTLVGRGGLYRCHRGRLAGRVNGWSTRDQSDMRGLVTAGRCFGPGACESRVGRRPWRVCS